eukprot:TRINITY_DN7114_c0_g1_i1.p1 TRINITY_DN7114_c0_g1~~TRINITY_DN7114_c0_g1_i1.p1  ORF type:complete len:439 (-),score=69.20 TRINITY_DN7114_c0_g1_i1:74-1249(-)
MFALAQGKWSYIYDHNAVEIHKLTRVQFTHSLEFLPYHFLLVSCSKKDFAYQDISTGAIPFHHKFEEDSGHANIIRQNPSNAIIHIAKTNGLVELWSPNSDVPLVKMLCHTGPVQDLVVDRKGRVMITAGADKKLKIWDLNSYKCLSEYYLKSAPVSLDLSQLGLLSISFNYSVEVWNSLFGHDVKKQEPYMRHSSLDSIQRARFCPFEDVLGLSTVRGFQSCIIPGSGEPNFDSWEVNPLATKKQRSEMLVNKLLEKIPSTLITLNPEAIGSVTTESDYRTRRDKLNRELTAGKVVKSRPKSQQQILSEKSIARREENIKNIMKQRQEKDKQVEAEKSMPDFIQTDDRPYDALNRFNRKRPREVIKEEEEGTTGAKRQKKPQVSTRPKQW